MKRIQIIKLLNRIAKGKKVPKLIHYGMKIKGHDVFVYDEELQEYIDIHCTQERLSVPNHHLTDYVDIIC